jgi:hypothetical protein
VRDSVTVHMAAPAELIWDLVSDVTRIGEFSPETFEAEWLDGATGPAAGARFRGHVKRNGRGPVYWKTCVVSAAEPGRDFAFAVMTGGKPLSSWRYQLEPAVGGTSVTESFELTPTLALRLYWAVLGRARGRTNRNGMRTTLERIRAAAEAGTRPATELPGLRRDQRPPPAPGQAGPSSPRASRSAARSASGMRKGPAMSRISRAAPAMVSPAAVTYSGLADCPRRTSAAWVAERYRVLPTPITGTPRSACR